MLVITAAWRLDTACRAGLSGLGWVELEGFWGWRVDRVEERLQAVLERKYVTNCGAPCTRKQRLINNARIKLRNAHRGKETRRTPKWWPVP